MVNFIMNHLFISVSFVFILIVLVLIFRFFIKMAIVLAIVVVVGSFTFGPKFLHTLQDPVGFTQKLTQSTIQPILLQELEDAKFSYNPETKQYLIQSTLFKLKGISTEDKAEIIFKGKKHTIDVSFLKSFIANQIAQQYKANTI